MSCSFKQRMVKTCCTNSSSKTKIRFSPGSASTVSRDGEKIINKQKRSNWFETLDTASESFNLQNKYINKIKKSKIKNNHFFMVKAVLKRASVLESRACKALVFGASPRLTMKILFQ